MIKNLKLIMPHLNYAHVCTSTHAQAHTHGVLHGRVLM